MNILVEEFLSKIKGITGFNFGIANEAGEVILSTSDKLFEAAGKRTRQFVEGEKQVESIDRITFTRVAIPDREDCVLFIEGTGQECKKSLEIASISIVNMCLYYTEKHDKINFIKQIILDNILPGDVSLRSKELQIEAKAFRAAFAVRHEKNSDVYTHEIIQNLFPDKNMDFVVFIDDENIVLIKELRGDEDIKEINALAKSIVNTVSSESMVKARVGIGTVVENISDIGRSFKEARTALMVGEVFEAERPVINYTRLGIGRLIYQLPETLCRLFLDEVFDEGAYESLDSETILTIQKFFENSLNVSETSRLLYVHRNTLVYRLDKILKITGLDLRNFDDAITFKVAMLVRKFLDIGERVL